MIKTKTLSPFSLTVCSLLLLWGTFPAFGNVLPETAKLLPPETVMLIEIKDFAQLRTQFEKTSIYQLYKDPAMAGFVEDLKNKWLEKTQQLDNTIFKSILEAKLLPSTRVSLAAVPNPQASDSNVPPVLFLSQWGANIDKIREAAEKIIQKAIADGFHKKTENYRDIRIEIILNASGAAVVNYCFIKDCLILSTDPAALKFLIAHLDGAASATLADEPDYSTAIKAMGPYHDVDFYMNIKKLISDMLAEERNDQAQMIAAAIGINNISFLASSAGLARQPGLDINARTLLKIDGPKKGICKILDIRPAVLQVPGFIPSPTYSVSFLNLDIKKAYNEFYNIVYNLSPMHAGLMFMPLLPPDPDGQPGLQLKNDIIDHLGSQIIVSHRINKPFSTDSGTPPVETLIAVQLDNKNELEKSLARLHSLYILSKNPDAKRQLLGHTIYIVTVPAMGFLRPGLSPMHQTEPSSPDQMRNLAFTVIDTYLILGTQQTVEQAIRTLNSPASESITSARWFNKAKSAIPSVIGMASLEDNQASCEFLWWLIKQKKSSAFPNTVMAVNPQLSFKQENANLFNPVLLPNFETVRKHFGLSSFYGITRPDGFFFEFKYLKPQNE